MCHEVGVRVEQVHRPGTGLLGLEVREAPWAGQLGWIMKMVGRGDKWGKRTARRKARRQDVWTA